MQAATQAAARGKLPILLKVEGEKPSVHVTMEWLREVGRIMADVDGMDEGMDAMLLDPMGTQPADFVVQDPDGSLVRLVVSAMKQVHKVMGKLERRRLGTLLWNVLQAAIKKPGLQQAKEQIAFEEFTVIKGPAQLEGANHRGNPSHALRTKRRMRNFGQTRTCWTDSAVCGNIYSQ